jgi:hypothetical protein
MAAGGGAGFGTPLEFGFSWALNGGMNPAWQRPSAHEKGMKTSPKYKSPTPSSMR